MIIRMMECQNSAISESKKVYNQQKIVEINKKPADQHDQQSCVESFIADKNEFPSLSEVSEPDKPLLKSSLCSTQILFTYSDKLKTSFQKEKLASNSNFVDCGSDFNSDSASSSNYSRMNMSNKVHEKVKIKIDNNNAQQNHGLHSHQKNSHFSSDVTCKKNTSPNNTITSQEVSKSKNKLKSEAQNRSPYNEERGVDSGNEQIAKAKKKKKRKSQVKRQVDLQKGKIMVLTPKAHSKILNQSCTRNSQVSKNIVTDINDSEEYPELGKSPMSKMIANKVSKKAEVGLNENEFCESSKKKDKDGKNVCCQSNPGASFVGKFTQESVQISFTGENSTSDKAAKTTVHKKDPITVSFLDMLVTSKAKAKEPKEKVDSRNTVPNKNKKAQPHNLLDSTPVLKRGKEREKPRTKRPTRLKKIILLDRKLRRRRVNKCIRPSLENKEKENDIAFGKTENQNQSAKLNQSTKMLQTLSCNDESSDQECSDEEHSLINSEDEVKSKREIFLNPFRVEDKDVLDSQISLCCNEKHSLLNSDDEAKCKREIFLNPFRVEDKVLDSEISLLEEHSAKSICKLESKNKELENTCELPMCSVSASYHENLMPEVNSSEKTSSCIMNEDTSISENNGFLQSPEIINENSENLTPNELSLSDKFENLTIKQSIYDADFTPNIANLQNVVQSAGKENIQAAKLVLHTRSFREYCTHLISKDIDDAVFALLDDLARFQDRMHQKDPVKAKMKRRLVYGIKEVKKHARLKKLKCIIIATDIENVQTEGGLNDVISDIKSYADDHHVPYIFSHSRKRLGKVCHKPVPVSCVGVFNYDGSEGNFKKLIELQKQSTKDYAEIFNNLVANLSEDSVRDLLLVKKVAPITLHELRTNILRKLLLPKINLNEDMEFSICETRKSSSIL